MSTLAADKVFHETDICSYDVALMAATGAEVPTTCISQLAEKIEAQLQVYVRELQQHGHKRLSLCVSIVASANVRELD